MSEAVETPTEPVQEGRSPRFTHWVALLVFSTITMGAAVELKNETEETNSDQRWVVFCSAITFCITLIVGGMHLHPLTSIFVAGTKIEGLIIIILAVFWAATVAVASDRGRGLAVDQGGMVQNGNLYYFSWAGFVATVMMIVSYLRAVFGVDVAGEIKSRSSRLTTWSIMLATSMVVMGASAKILSDECAVQVNATDTYCSRTKFGLSVGVFGVFFSLAVVGLKIATSRAPFLVESSLAVLLAVLFGFGVAYITSASGPGAPLGNLYYFTWASFICSLFLVANCVEDYQAAQRANEVTSPHGNPDIQMEVPDV